MLRQPAAASSNCSGGSRSETNSPPADMENAVNGDERSQQQFAIASRAFRHRTSGDVAARFRTVSVTLKSASPICDAVSSSSPSTNPRERSKRNAPEDWLRGQRSRNVDAGRRQTSRSMPSCQSSQVVDQLQEADLHFDRRPRAAQHQAFGLHFPSVRAGLLIAVSRG